jgi:Xaa-Pro dipeptidase
MATSEWPAVSPQEQQRRATLVHRLCLDAHLDALVVYGSSANARQAQAPVHFLTGFLGHQDAYVLWVAGREPTLFVQYYNHLPHARRVARAEVRWGGARSIDAVADEVARLSGAARVGLVGPVPYREHQRLVARLADVAVVDVTASFIGLRLVKSEEELQWMRRAAVVTDAALLALVAAAIPGASELELQAQAVAAAIRAGGQPHFLYLSSTPMANPDRIVPQQELSDRRLQTGDVVILELSGALSAYSGQVLRTLTIGVDLNDQYRRLHEVAWEAFHEISRTVVPGATARDVVTAADRIEKAGFTICDDLVHGYGGGYLPPVLRTPNSLHAAVPDFTFEANMTLVIQPNVVTTDQRAGVQVGELVRVADGGAVSLHGIPQRVLRGGEVIPPTMP